MGNVDAQWNNGRSHTDKVAREVLDWSAAHGRPVYWMWVLGDSGHHRAGRAIDFMTLTDNQRSYRDEIGNEIAAYLRANAKRFGVEYVIWRRRIWNATRADDRKRVAWSSWRHMEDRGNPTANHEDHVHVSLLDQPSAYRPPATTPAPTPKPPEDDVTPQDIEKVADRVVAKLIGRQLDPGPYAERIGGYDKDTRLSVGGVLVGADAWGRNANRKLDDLNGDHAELHAKLNELAGLMREINVRLAALGKTPQTGE